MLRKHLSLFVFALLVLVVIGGCVPVRANGPAVQTATAAGLRPIAVSNVTVEVGVGSPIPVDAFVSGEWPDLCAQLALITQQFEDNAFEITLLATAADPACPPDYLGLPFRIAIPLNVVQLPEGEYIVTANGASTTFTVPVPAEATVEMAATELPPAAAASPATMTPEPTGGTVAHYHGPNPYRATRLNIIQYSSARGDISWIFGVLLPEAYSGLGNSNCQDAAEQVIDTFTVVE